VELIAVGLISFVPVLSYPFFRTRSSGVNMGMGGMGMPAMGMGMGMGGMMGYPAGMPGPMGYPMMPMQPAGYGGPASYQGELILRPPALHNPTAEAPYSRDYFTYVLQLKCSTHCLRRTRVRGQLPGPRGNYDGVRWHGAKIGPLHSPDIDSSLASHICSRL
jgi:hypothetical protein